MVNIVLKIDGWFKIIEVDSKILHRGVGDYAIRPLQVSRIVNSEACESSSMCYHQYKFAATGKKQFGIRVYELMG